MWVNYKLRSAVSGSSIYLFFSRILGGGSLYLKVALCSPVIGECRAAEIVCTLRALNGG